MAEANLSKSIQKFPKTPHLPFSPGINEDDIIMSYEGITAASIPILSEEAILTEKLDGGNCSLFQGTVYGRTVGAEASHLSFGPIKQLCSAISCMIPDNMQIFGENMFGIHSIEYSQLDSYFYIFAALEDGNRWLSWSEVVELSEMLGIPTVHVIQSGVFKNFKSVENVIKEKMKEKSQFGTNTPEGFVIRCVRECQYKDYERYSAKYVRAGHIQTDEKWKKTWKQAKLCPK